MGKLFKQSRRGRGARLRVPAILLIAAGLMLLVAAVSLGKNGPSLSGFSFAVDSSGTGPPPPPPVTKPAPVPAPDATAPTLTVKGAKSTKKLRPSFNFEASETSTFVCKLGSKPAAPCTSPFKVPNLGPGRHVLVVWAIDAAGNASMTKYPYVVKKPQQRK